MDKNFSPRYLTVYRKYSEIVARTGARCSESGLARFLDVSQTTSQRWKNGQIPDPISLKMIHDKLGFSYDWLIAGEGEVFDATVKSDLQLKNEPSLGKAAGQE